MTTMVQVNTMRVGWMGWEHARVYLDNEEQTFWIYANALEKCVHRYDCAIEDMSHPYQKVKIVHGDVKIFIPKKCAGFRFGT